MPATSRDKRSVVFWNVAEAKAFGMSASPRMEDRETFPFEASAIDPKIRISEAR